MAPKTLRLVTSSDHSTPLATQAPFPRLRLEITGEEFIFYADEAPNTPAYRRQLEAIIALYEGFSKLGLLHEVNGSKDPNDLHKQVVDTVRLYRKT